MKVKLLVGIVLGPGEIGEPGHVVEVEDRLAYAWIHERRAVPDAGDLVDELPPPPSITNRDPELVNRDPKPGKGGRR